MKTTDPIYWMPDSGRGKHKVAAIDKCKHCGHFAFKHDSLRGPISGPCTSDGCYCRRYKERDTE